MGKSKIGVLIMGVFLLTVFIVSLILFLNGDPRATISGLAFSNLQELPFEMNLSLIAFVGQWVVLLLIVFIAYMRFLKHRREEEEKVKTFTIPKDLPKSTTNLDVMYDLLQQNKSLSVSIISRLFSITKEKALEWARILEDKDLVIIEYPAFSDPEVRLKDSKDEPNEEKNVKEEEEDDEF